MINEVTRIEVYGFMYREVKILREEMKGSRFSVRERGTVLRV
jgi:hypothetical protein